MAKRALVCGMAILGMATLVSFGSGCAEKTNEIVLKKPIAVKTTPAAPRTAAPAQPTTPGATTTPTKTVPTSVGQFVKENAKQAAAKAKAGIGGKSGTSSK